MCTNCPVCETGKLTEHVDINEINGKEIECLYSLCDHCGSELANARQMKLNKDKGVNSND